MGEKCKIIFSKQLSVNTCEKYENPASNINAKYLPKHCTVDHGTKIVKSSNLSQLIKPNNSMIIRDVTSFVDNVDYNFGHSRLVRVNLYNLL